MWYCSVFFYFAQLEGSIVLRVNDGDIAADNNAKFVFGIDRITRSDNAGQAATAEQKASFVKVLDQICAEAASARQKVTILVYTYYFLSLCIFCICMCCQFICFYMSIACDK